MGVEVNVAVGGTGVSVGTGVDVGGTGVWVGGGVAVGGIGVGVSVGTGVSVVGMAVGVSVGASWAIAICQIDIMNAIATMIATNRTVRPLMSPLPISRMRVISLVEPT